MPTRRMDKTRLAKDKGMGAFIKCTDAANIFDVWQHRSIIFKPYCHWQGKTNIFLFSDSFLLLELKYIFLHSKDIFGHNTVFINAFS